MKTKQIVPNQDFKHGPKTYKKGRKYDVDSVDAAYFESAGWVGTPSTESRAKNLEIQDMELGHSSEVN